MSNIEEGMKVIPLSTLIMEAGDELGMLTQYTSLDNLHFKVNASIAAKTLIELAETMVCGSVGGYDDGQQTEKGMKYADKYDPLFARWYWLFKHYVRKPSDKTDLGHKGWRTVADLKEAFKER